MTFFLDSNVVIGLLRRNHRIGEKLRQQKPATVAISTMAMHELYFGAFNSGRQAQNLQYLDEIGLPVLEFTGADAWSAGLVRATLFAQGRPIGPYDVLIAGQALSRDMTLVTHNQREFRRVEALRLEDWEA